MHANLQTPVAQQLLNSTIPARLAFVGANGHPHVAPIWFLWRNEQIVLGAHAESFKVTAIKAHPQVALTIDSESTPYRSLRVRGVAEIEIVDGILPEYAECAQRYYGAERGQRWIDWFGSFTQQMARISIEPDWVEALDFRERFASVFDADV
jgi:hypothetical protein